MKLKSIGYFPDQVAKNSIDVMRAVYNSTLAHGIAFEENNLDADAALIWSVLWRGRMARNQKIYEHYRDQGRPVIVIDVGALRRGITWKVSLNHINNLGFYGHQENLDPSRPGKLGINLRDSKDIKSDAVLIASQHLGSLQVADINLMTWLENKILEIRSGSDRPLIFRPHPRCHLDLSRFQTLGLEIQHPRKLVGSYDEFDLMLDYHATVNYNSGPGIRAALMGSRPIVDNSSLAFPVSVVIDDIEKPYDIDRQQWLIEICHTEYTVEEISQGSWLKRLHLI